MKTVLACVLCVGLLAVLARSQVDADKGQIDQPVVVLDAPVAPETWTLNNGVAQFDGLSLSVTVAPCDADSGALCARLSVTNPTATAYNGTLPLTLAQVGAGAEMSRVAPAPDVLHVERLPVTVDAGGTSTVEARLDIPTEAQGQLSLVLGDLEADGPWGGTLVASYFRAAAQPL